MEARIFELSPHEVVLEEKTESTMHRQIDDDKDEICEKQGLRWTCNAEYSGYDLRVINWMIQGSNSNNKKRIRAHIQHVGAAYVKEKETTHWR